jgi:polysaccharide chain length determinant protein (PEP-CTERM system associated)
VLPGKTYSPEEIIRIAGRRTWLIVIPLALGLLVAVTVSKRLPNQYRSETLIMLVPQRIPDSYVKSAVSDVNVEDRLAGLQDQILSRSRLERIIVDLGLYRSLRRSLTMEEVVSRMRLDVSVKIEAKESSFRLSYISNDAGTAQKTTARLASLFIEESLRDRRDLAEDTNQFLNSQLEDAKRRLIEHEKKLEEYRRHYSGELPSQVASNLTVIQNAQVQLQTLGDATDRVRERRLLLERQLGDLQSSDPLLQAAVPLTAAPLQEGMVGETTGQQLETARGKLKQLELRDKPDHPDVRAMQRTIRDLEAKQQAEGNNKAEPASIEKPITPAEALRQKRIRDLSAQIADIDRELAEKQQQEQRLHGVIAEYQAKVDVLPTRESELVELTRDYATLQTEYQTLLTRREDSKMAANLERQNIGQQYKILDPAGIPEKPFSPNRLLINLAGGGGGLIFGLMLAAWLEYRDSSLKGEDDVVRLFELPVLAVVPVMMSSKERQTRRRRGVYVGIATVLVLLGTVAAFMLVRPNF